MVLEKAGATIDPNGLRLIARAADGGMRDALSLADQCLSFAGNTVSEQDVYDALGTVSGTTLERTAQALLNGNAADAVRALDDVIANGRDLGVFLNDLARHFRALLLAKTCGDCADLLDCTDDQMQRYLKAAKGADESRILYALEQMLKVQSTLKLFASPRIPIEAAFIRICRPVDDQSFAALESRVALLEQRPVSAAPAIAQRAEEPAYDEPPMLEAPPAEPVFDDPWETEQAQPAQQAETPRVQPIAQPKPKPAIAPEPKTAPEPAPEPKRESAPESASSGDAEAIWASAKAKILELNPMVFMYAKDTRGVQLSDDVLTVEFPASQESKLNGITAARNLQTVKTAIESVRPGTELHFRLAQLMNENEEKLKELFGSSLTIN